MKINRNEDAPFQIDIKTNNEGKGFYAIKNFMGFSVDLTLTEVSTAYAEALPTFKDYYTKGYNVNVISKG